LLVVDEIKDGALVKQIHPVKFQMWKQLAQLEAIFAGPAAQIENSLGAVQAAKKPAARIKVQKDFLCRLQHRQCRVSYTSWFLSE
jgi:hypothetical protein